MKLCCHLALFMLFAASCYREAACHQSDGHVDDNDKDDGEGKGKGKGKGKGCKGGKGGKGASESDHRRLRRRLQEESGNDVTVNETASNSTQRLYRWDNENRPIREDECEEDEDSESLAMIVGITASVACLCSCIGGLWIYVCCREQKRKQGVVATSAQWQSSEMVVGNQVAGGHLPNEKPVDGIVLDPSAHCQ